jgi:hypothetical protein
MKDQVACCTGRFDMFGEAFKPNPPLLQRSHDLDQILKAPPESI